MKLLTVSPKVELVNVPPLFGDIPYVQPVVVVATHWNGLLDGGIVEFTRNTPSCSVGLKITCSAALGSGSTQPNWLLLLVPQVVEPLQHTGLLVMVRNWLPAAEVTVASTACADRLARVTDCGAARLATCVDD